MSSNIRKQCVNLLTHVIILVEIFDLIFLNDLIWSSKQNFIAVQSFNLLLCIDHEEVIVILSLIIVVYCLLLISQRFLSFLAVLTIRNDW